MFNYFIRRFVFNFTHNFNPLANQSYVIQDFTKTLRC